MISGKAQIQKIFLQEAARLVAERGGLIAHCDVTVICEAPKLRPHVDVMRQSLAGILELSVDRISVKATTSERLGFTGRGEGIAATATATVRLPMS
jgi:2-C-methyl-D-erythritol 4-phosphate cytidylyltransferase/2-C-methyl-D-erythritol 2,4-cyclodiphosphate synthase